MPVYSLPAADVKAAVTKAIAASDDVRKAREALDWWNASTQGQEVAAAVADGRMTRDDAIFGTLLGHFTREHDKAVAAVRRKVELAYTVITPREVTAGLRQLFPQCDLASRDAGPNRIEVTVPERPARDLLWRGTEHAEKMLRDLLHTAVQVTGTREFTARCGSPRVTFTLEFPVLP